MQGVGMAMRELLHTVDGIRQRIPVQSHHEVNILSFTTSIVIVERSHV